MRSHELARMLLSMPDGEVILDMETDVRADEIPDVTAYGAYPAVYSGQPAIEISTRYVALAERYGRLG